VLLLDDMTSSDRDQQVQSISHGVILLDHVNPEYGSDRRRLRVIKYRGVNFRGGYHDFVLERGGLVVFPRLVAAEHRRTNARKRIESGLTEFDKLLGGGIEQGSSTLMIGAAGTGKSTLSSQFCASVANQGERAAMFLFDESLETLLNRADGLNIGLRKHVESGHVIIQPVDPAELSPGEFIHRIRTVVEQENVSVLVIDSLNGYLNAMPGERHLIIQLHELLMYLGQQGVATILVCAQQGLVGPNMTSPIDASYLADCVVLLRYFEAEGELRQAISVLKKRGGAHERTIREFRLANGRIEIGEPLRKFRGVLTGVPVENGAQESLHGSKG